MLRKKGKRTLWTMKGTIVGASKIQDFHTKSGKTKQSAILHIQENAGDASSAEVAVKVTDELCNYVGCIGARVVVEYVVRVFNFMKDGIQSIGNDIYATNISRLGR